MNLNFIKIRFRDKKKMNLLLSVLDTLDDLNQVFYFILTVKT